MHIISATVKEALQKSRAIADSGGTSRFNNAKVALKVNLIKAINLIIGIRMARTGPVDLRSITNFIARMGLLAAS